MSRQSGTMLGPSPWWPAERLEEAVEEQSNLATLIAAMPPQRVVLERNTAVHLLRIALLIVTGEIAAHRGHFKEAIASLQKAVQLQDQLHYTEPPSWYYPVRHSLGAVLLAADQPTEAEAVYREDLRRNPQNGWSLYGLAQSLRALGKDEEAATVERQFQTAWERADISVKRSRF